MSEGFGLVNALYPASCGFVQIFGCFWARDPEFFSESTFSAVSRV